VTFFPRFVRNSIEESREAVDRLMSIYRFINVFLIKCSTFKFIKLPLQNKEKEGCLTLLSILLNMFYLFCNRSAIIERICLYYIIYASRDFRSGTQVHIITYKPKTAQILNNSGGFIIFCGELRAAPVCHIDKLVVCVFSPSGAIIFLRFYVTRAPEILHSYQVTRHNWQWLYTFYTIQA